MMRLKPCTPLVVAFAMLLSTGASALADNYLNVNWTAFGADSHPGLIFTINPDLSVSLTDGHQGPYDGIEDTYVGVINHSAQSVYSFVVSSSLPIYGFDGDGLDESPYNSPGNLSDDTGYGGPQAYFTGIDSNQRSGTVNFEGGIAPGGSTYFSLEEVPSTGDIGGGGVISGTAVPEPTPILLAGMGILGLVGYPWGRRKQVA
jgi:hypothetical protein